MTWCLRRSEEGTESRGTRVSGTCEALCGCWKQKPDPLEVLSHSSGPLSSLASSLTYSSPKSLYIVVIFVFVVVF